MKKRKVLLCAAIALSGAVSVGALAADPGKPVIAPIISLLLNRDTSIPYAELNEPVKLISVSSGNSDSLTADWLPSEDSATPASLMRYTLHVSIDEGFEPSAATAKGSVTGKETLTVTGLQPDTQYFALIAATDSDGHESWSNRLPVRTVATAAVRTSAVVEAQEQDQNPVVTPDTVAYTAEQVPATGEYLASSDGDGYLRKVVSATSANGVVTAQT
ncbi:MAG: fibronectin type III domain-containing protein, partial [Candidatus Electrothrix sp. MAN1_4]|nr:fibronectin type III domain-containing protein [Candidatus Electrothrix sp. MAN1_4]